MAFKVFIDVNVFLDFFLKRNDFTNAEKILKVAKDEKITAFTSISAFQSVSYFLQKYRGAQIAKQLLIALLSTIKLIESSEEIVVQSLNSPINDIEDAIHYFTALQYQIDYLITNDIDFLKLDGTALNIKTPEDFLKLLQP